ncbi:MAG: AAA family ATPase [Paludibacteraceae bacterium]|nr:AAA family ATPase [Paludibacteraceae bacterium]
MKRNIYAELLKWKNNPKHKPLVLLGARQVGKTYIVKEFGKNEFDNMLYINCHNNKFASGLFADFNIERIIYQIEQAYECKIVIGKTLIFFDEIQEVENGIPSLKYFCEEKRDLHVVVAGSMLGISLRENGSYPVGKVDDMRMYPMTYDEFLLANNRDLLAEAVRKLDWDSMKLHFDTLTEYLRQYYFVGGMPEAVSIWIENHSAAEVRKVQRAILANYSKDMGKHTKTEIARIRQVWNSIPAQLAKENKKFIFGAIKKGGRASDFEKALQWLADAGLIYKIPRTLKPVEPLKFYADESAFKVYMLDHGLLAYMAGTRSSKMLLGMEVFSEFKGAFTENFVLTQIKSLELHDEMDKNVFYYSKDNSAMEVDFIVQGCNRIVPTEVKAEDNVHAKSLSTFINYEFAAQKLKGLRISMKPYINQQWMENIPLFSTEAFFADEGLGI